MWPYLIGIIVFIASLVVIIACYRAENRRLQRLTPEARDRELADQQSFL